MEKQDKVFIDGLIFKLPDENTKEKAPWVKGKISVKVSEFIAFLNKYNNNGWVNIDLKKSKEKGTLYLELNRWIKKETDNSGLDKVDYPTEDIKVEDVGF